MENVDKGILDRMDINNNNTCFVTLKEHKGNFLNNTTVRLININQCKKYSKRNRIV